MMNPEISRREFLRAAAGAAGVVLMAGCSSETDGTRTSEADRWIAANGEAAAPVAASRNPDGTLRVRGGGKLRPGTAIAFTFAPDETPGIVCATNAGELYALSAKCTHADCTVVWQRNGEAARLHCPCHFSNFDMEGHVLNGPATMPLQRYTVRVEDGDAIVTLVPSGGAGRKAEIKR